MNLVLLFAALVAPVMCAIDSENTLSRRVMLETNRIPKTKTQPESEESNSIQVGNIDSAENVELSFCSECESVIQEMADVLKNPRYVEDLKQKLRNMCPYFKVLIDEQQCNNMINDDLEALLHQIIPVLEKKEQFCAQIGLCNSNDNEITFAQKMFLNVLKHDINSIKLGKDLRTAVCDECQFVLTEFSSLLQDQTIQDDIKAEIEKSCVALKTFSDECKALVDQYFPMIIQQLQNMLKNPKTLCAELKLCPSLLSVPRSLAHQQMESSPGFARVQLHRQLPLRRLSLIASLVPRRQTTFGISTGCVICETVVDAILAEIKRSNETKESILSDVQMLCGKVLPSELANQCVGFVNLYGRTIIDMLVQEMNAETVCHSLDVCDTQEVMFMTTLGSVQRSEVACDACRGTVEFLKIELGNPDVQQEITHFMEFVCDSLRDTYKQTCHEQVDIRVPQILQVLDNYLNPEMCTNVMQLC